MEVALCCFGREPACLLLDPVHAAPAHPVHRRHRSLPPARTLTLLPHLTPPPPGLPASLLPLCPLFFGHLPAARRPRRYQAPPALLLLLPLPPSPWRRKPRREGRGQRAGGGCQGVLQLQAAIPAPPLRAPTPGHSPCTECPQPPPLARARECECSGRRRRMRAHARDQEWSSSAGQRRGSGRGGNEHRRAAAASPRSAPRPPAWPSPALSASSLAQRLTHTPSATSLESVHPLRGAAAHPSRRSASTTEHAGKQRWETRWERLPL